MLLGSMEVYLPDRSGWGLGLGCIILVLVAGLQVASSKFKLKNGCLNLMHRSLEASISSVSIIFRL